ncbi:hypothetical protein B296_00010109 [Ensete ventricosum]|uniref:Uncharacterized protein n=1 Tax=Ensete ventricosum TaxID=4639 RepID=A0A427B7F5_ENSVE|nr:hypothetical protein B296_00010109 [Ensete ventricosum]
MPDCSYRFRTAYRLQLLDLLLEVGSSIAHNKLTCFMDVVEQVHLIVMALHITKGSSKIRESSRATETRVVLTHTISFAARARSTSEGSEQSSFASCGWRIPLSNSAAACGSSQTWAELFRASHQVRISLSRSHGDRSHKVFASIGDGAPDDVPEVLASRFFGLPP